MDYTIREATVLDAEQKAYVHYTSWLETYPGLMPKEYLGRLSLDNCIRIAKNHPENTLVAEVDGKIVGFSCYMENAREHASIKPASEIMAIYVLKKFQKKKIGYALMMEALRRLSKDKVVLFVLDGNDKAIEFYRKFGFKFTGHKEIVQVPGGKLVDLEMVLERKKD